MTNEINTPTNLTADQKAALQQAQMHLESIEANTTTEDIQKLKWAAIYLIQMATDGHKPENFDEIITAANAFYTEEL